MPTLLRRSLCAALLVAAAAPALAEARSEQGVFTVELSGSYSAGWASPGVPSGHAAYPDQMRGQVQERGSFRTREPIPIVVQGLWGRDLQFYNLRESSQDGIPVDAEIVRSGSLERVRFKRYDEMPREQQKSCNSGQPTAADPGCLTADPMTLDTCFGERRFSGTAGLSLSPLSIRAPGDNVDTRIFNCGDEPSFTPSSLTPSTWDGMAARGTSGAQRFKSAKPGSKWTVKGIEVRSDCRIPAPATCTPAILEATATFRFVCRSPTSMKGCVTPKLRKRLKL